MGAEGEVWVYDYEAVDAHHRALWGRGIREDWTYLHPGDPATIPLGPRGMVDLPCSSSRLILRYREHPADEFTHDTADDFWCKGGEVNAASGGVGPLPAGERVRRTLEDVGPLACCEVWT